MTMIGIDVDPLAAHGGMPPAPAARPPGVRLWRWVVLASALLGASGLVRGWQDRRFEAIMTRSDPAPFPLKDLTTELTGWRYLEGGDQRLDPQIARVAGSSDHVIRTYIDEVTGVAVTVLVIYGHGQFLSQHVPEVCYPNAGFTLGDDPFDREIPTGRGTLARFRSLAFAKGGGSADVRDEVYYSFRHDDRWYPDAAGDWKRFRHNPSMFKVQVQRRLAPRERRLVANPTEQFLARFLPVLEARIAQGAGPSEPKATAN
jgi:hypothetical protein